jgi:hypothetical protein
METPLHKNNKENTVNGILVKKNRKKIFAIQKGKKLLC